MWAGCRSHKRVNNKKLIWQNHTSLKVILTLQPFRYSFNTSLPCKRNMTFQKKKKFTKGTSSCFSLSTWKFTPTASLNTVLQPLLLTLHINTELFPQASVPNTVSRLHLHGNELSNSTAITSPKCWKESQICFLFPMLHLPVLGTVQVSPRSTRPLGRPRQTNGTQE